MTIRNYCINIGVNKTLKLHYVSLAPLVAWSRLYPNDRHAKSFRVRISKATHKKFHFKNKFKLSDVFQSKPYITFRNFR